MKINKRAGLGWLGGILAFGVVDYTLACRRDGSSFSEGNRWLFRTDTPEGRVAFLVTLSGLATAYAVHILGRKARA